MAQSFTNSTRTRINRLLLKAKGEIEFYRRYPERINNLAEYRVLPLINQGDVADYLPPKGRKLMSSKTANYSVWNSGGTGGKRKFMVYNFGSIIDLMKRTAKEFPEILGKGDVAANMFPGGNCWVGYQLMHLWLNNVDCINLPVGNFLSSPEIIPYWMEVFEDFKVNTVLSTPTTAINLARYVEENNIDFKINKFYYGGELPTPSQIEFLKKVFRVNEFVSAYGVTETMVFSFKYKECPIGNFHVMESDFFVEIISETNEIVVTPLWDRLVPLVRYKTGDTGRWVDCPCGRRLACFRMTGRVINRFNLGGTRLDYQLIDEIIGKFLDPGYLLQLELTTNRSTEGLERERMTLYIIGGENIGERELAEEVFAHNLELSAYRKFGKIEIVVRFVDRLPYPNTRTDKLRKVIDLRTQN